VDSVRDLPRYLMKSITQYHIGHHIITFATISLGLVNANKNYRTRTARHLQYQWICFIAVLLHFCGRLQ